jgi:hypothetical protein
LLLGFTLFAAGCSAVESEPENNDGSFCAKNADCSSGVCTRARLCAHSGCNCPGDTCSADGEVVPECRPGWVCMDYKSLFDPVVEFFDAEPDQDDGYCQPLCAASCPEHYECRGTQCVADEDWVKPRLSVSWSGAAQGSTQSEQTLTLPNGSSLTLSAEATSPLGLALEPFVWTIVDGSSGARDEFNGPSVELSVEGIGSYRRAELTVSDVEAHSSSASVVLQSCRAAGTACGYDGLGCCDGCNRSENVCR